MEIVYYISTGVAVSAAVMVVSRSNAVHAMLYLLVSLLALAIAFYALGAPFAAAMEVIIYAGAILVLFVFAVMMLGLSHRTADQERRLLGGRIWVGPVALGAVLLGEVIYVLLAGPQRDIEVRTVTPTEVGQTLFGPYLTAVEISSMLLTAGLIGAYHLARRYLPAVEEGEDES